MTDKLYVVPPADNVETLEILTRLNMSAERVLLAAVKHGLQNVVICSFDRNGDEYFASSVADGGSALWLIERCKKVLLGLPETWPETDDGRPAA